MNVLILEKQGSENPICDVFHGFGYCVEVEHNICRGLQKCLASQCDLVILGLSLDHDERLKFLARLRDVGHLMPALALLPATEEDWVVRLLQAGADDVVRWPVSSRELTARADALYRRAHGFGRMDTRLEFEGLELDLIARTATRAGQRILLKPREFLLLEYLMRRSNQVVSRDELLEQVWGYDFDPQTNVVEVHISRLRAKLDRDFARPMLKTIRVKGYMLCSSSGRELSE